MTALDFVIETVRLRTMLGHIGDSFGLCNRSSEIEDNFGLLVTDLYFVVESLFEDKFFV